MAKEATKQSADVVAGIDAQIQGVIAEIDAQIAKLAEKRTALLGLFGTAAVAAAGPVPGAKRRGRPKGSKGTKKAAKKQAAGKTGRKRVFSEETKQKLKEAAKARWAKVHAEQGEA